MCLLSARLVIRRLPPLTAALALVFALAAALAGSGLPWTKAVALGLAASQSGPAAPARFLDAKCGNDAASRPQSLGLAKPFRAGGDHDAAPFPPLPAVEHRPATDGTAAGREPAARLPGGLLTARLATGPPA